MKSKKLLLMVLVLLAGIMAFAEQYMEGVDFVQYTKKDFGTYSTYQNWNDAKMITVKVTAGSTVYLTNYVDDWYGGAITDLGNPEFDLGYDMHAGKYGYVFAEIDAAGNAKPVGDFHPGDGTTATVTYKNPKGWYGQVETQDVTGYKLDTFDKDAEIFLVMTPNGYDGTQINTYSPVYDPYNDPSTLSILKSRHVDPEDQAANARVNPGIGSIYNEDGSLNPDGKSHEFVIGYVASAEPPEPPSGQPLPGVLTSCLVALGATSIAARRRKQSRK